MKEWGDLKNGVFFFEGSVYFLHYVALGIAAESPQTARLSPACGEDLQQKARPHFF